MTNFGHIVKWGYLGQKSSDSHDFWTKYGGFVLVRADMIAFKTPESTTKNSLRTILQHPVSYIRMHGDNVATSASSGIAATFLHLGRTSHNQFKLPFIPRKDSYCNIKSPLKTECSYCHWNLILHTESITCNNIPPFWLRALEFLRAPARSQ